jgi:hypothetical protein
MGNEGMRRETAGGILQRFIDRHTCVDLPNALVQLQAEYHHCGEAASEKCLSAATFVGPRETKEWPNRLPPWSRGIQFTNFPSVAHPEQHSENNRQG